MRDLKGLLTKYTTGLSALVLLASCSSGLNNPTGDGRIQNLSSPIVLVNDSGSVQYQSVSTGSSTVSASALLPVFLLTATIAPPPGMQATDVTYISGNAFTSYSTRDTTGLLRAGAIEHDALNLSILGITVSLGSIVQFPTTNIYQSTSDGVNLYAVGSDRNNASSTNNTYGRIFKLPLSSSKDISSIAATANLPGYAGTGVAVIGSKVYATSGTAQTSPDMGGLSILNTADLSSSAFQSLYDARGVSFSSYDLSTVYVTRAPNSSTSGDTAKVLPYTAAGAASSNTAFSLTGNNIAESKSNVIIGRNLVISSQGDKGFTVNCKTGGAWSITVPNPVVTGLTAAQTVTNSITASPGYIFAANGEAGVYVYSIQRTNALSSTICGNVTLTNLGYMKTFNTQVGNANGILSANQVSYFTLVNALNIVTAKFLLVASGNTGTSVVTMAVVAPLPTDIDDF